MSALWLGKTYVELRISLGSLLQSLAGALLSLGGIETRGGGDATRGQTKRLSGGEHDGWWCESNWVVGVEEIWSIVMFNSRWRSGLVPVSDKMREATGRLTDVPRTRDLVQPLKKNVCTVLYPYSTCTSTPILRLGWRKLDSPCQDWDISNGPTIKSNSAGSRAQIDQDDQGRMTERVRGRERRKDNHPSIHPSIHSFVPYQIHSIKAINYLLISIIAPSLHYLAVLLPLSLVLVTLCCGFIQQRHPLHFSQPDHTTTIESKYHSCTGGILPSCGL